MNNRRERGFTLVEILIVMVIVGIMASLAVPNLRPMFKKDKLRASTTSVTSSLYMARTKSVNDGRPYGVKFETSGQFYMVSDPKGTPTRWGVPHRLEDEVSIVSNTFVNGLVIFNEYGQLDKSCLPTGAFTGTIILSDGSPNSTRVDITYISGRIRETNL
jgi:type II secretion system protein H